MDAAKFKPAPDRPRIFMSKSGKVVIVFPNGEIVEGEFTIRKRANVILLNNFISYYVSNIRFNKFITPALQPLFSL